MSPGMLSALGIPVDLATTLDLLAATYPDGEAVTTRVGEHNYGAPDNLEDLLNGLAKRNDGHDDGDEHPSNIDVKIIKDANGNVTGYVVDIPGTKDWPLPGQVKSANDLGVNVDAMAGNNTVLQEGIQEALRKAGAQGTDAPVMLVGHSQGGIVAAQATTDLKANGYNVTHVVTAGSPVGRIDVPSDVQVLSLENRNDIVPHLDASDNPGSPNRTTVTFDNQTGGFSGNHAIRENYTEAARQLDSGSDPSVARFKESASVFFNGDDQMSVTQNYHVARKGVNELP
jgi:hypothetical protein